MSKPGPRGSSCIRPATSSSSATTGSSACSDLPTSFTCRSWCTRRGHRRVRRQPAHVLGRFPGAGVILAHAGLTDLSWAAGHPILVSPTDLVTLFGTLHASQILFGSDVPCSTPTWGAHATAVRLVPRPGLGSARVRDGGQARRLVDHAEPADLGPAPGRVRRWTRCWNPFTSTPRPESRPPQRDDTQGQMMDLARLCCRVRPDHPHKAVFDSVRVLLDLYEPPTPRHGYRVRRRLGPHRHCGPDRPYARPAASRGVITSSLRRERGAASPKRRRQTARS